MTLPHQGSPPPPEDMKWPPVKEDAAYVMDSHGVVWYLCPEYNRGMATTATTAGPWSVGINMLIKDRSPLHILRVSGEHDFRDYCATLGEWRDANEPREIVATSGPREKCTVCGKRPLQDPGSSGLGGALCLICIINQAALDFIKTSAMESGIELTESDINMIEWGIIAGSWATYKHINDETEARQRSRRSWRGKK